MHHSQGSADEEYRATCVFLSNFFFLMSQLEIILKARQYRNFKKRLMVSAYAVGAVQGLV